MNSPSPSEITQRIENRTARIGVVGMGYVGLPLALLLAAKGFYVIGFDVDPGKVADLSAGRSYISHIPDDLVGETFAGGGAEATTDFSRATDADAILVCVPTPLTEAKEPELSYVKSTFESLATYQRPGQLFVLESTTYPGTSREVVKPILEAGGLKSGTDFFLAYSPEREDPGNAEFGTAKIPKVVGADDEVALSAACALYAQIVTEVIPVSSMDVAEAVKLTENIFRSVNIALVNELKSVYAAMGIDIWEVIEAAKTKPFGYMPFYPGPGLGGHCIPIDPFYLSWRARQYGEATRFVELAGEINTAMPAKVLGVVERELRRNSDKPIDGARILLIGLAYKKNVDDTRESPGLTLLDMLNSAGAEAAFYDPYIPVIPATREHPDLTGMKSISWNAEQLASYDAALICTDHDNIDFDALVQACPLVIDTRNATKSARRDAGRVVKA